MRRKGTGPIRAGSGNFVRQEIEAEFTQKMAEEADEEAENANEEMLEQWSNASGVDEVWENKLLSEDNGLEAAGEQYVCLMDTVQSLWPEAASAVGLELTNLEKAKHSRAKQNNWGTAAKKFAYALSIQEWKGHDMRMSDGELRFEQEMADHFNPNTVGVEEDAEPSFWGLTTSLECYQALLAALGDGDKVANDPRRLAWFGYRSAYTGPMRQLGRDPVGLSCYPRIPTVGRLGTGRSGAQRPTGDTGGDVL